jgi:hypothetical protein
MISKSIIAINDRLVQVEERLAAAMRRKGPYPAVVVTLSREAAAPREELWALRRNRWERGVQEARP